MIALSLRQQPMAERVGHAQERWLFQAAKAPIGDEVVVEVNLVEKYVLRRIGTEELGRPAELRCGRERKRRLDAIPVAEDRQAVADREHLDRLSRVEHPDA